MNQVRGYQYTYRMICLCVRFRHSLFQGGIQSSRESESEKVRGVEKDSHARQREGRRKSLLLCTVIYAL